MDVYLHGGKCCGIKHIFGLGSSPNSFIDDKRKTKGIKKNESVGYYNSTLNFFSPSAPQEKYKDRLKRIVGWIIKMRPHGIIEIVLSNFQINFWREHVEALGFTQVSKANNSNSNGVIYVFHKVY